MAQGTLTVSTVDAELVLSVRPDGQLPDDAERLAKLAALALALTPLLAAEQIMAAAAEHLAALLPGGRGYALVWQEDGLTHQARFGTPPPALLPQDLAPTGLCALALTDDLPRVVERSTNARALLAPWEWALAGEPRTLVAAPLAVGGGARGALLIACGAPPGAADVRLLDAACTALGGALGRARAHSSAQTERLAGMGRLTAAIAHEVNNPLQAISNSLHLLLSRTLSEDKRTRYLSLAQKEVELLIDLVRRMLDFSQPTRDGMRPVAIHSVLESVLLATADQFRERGVTVERQWDTQLPRVSGVVSHLKQAFLTLVLASLEATPAGGTLTLRTSVVDREGRGDVVVELADTGGRMPEDELRTIFEPFFRTRRDGTGMGLPVSYTIIAQHGGRVSAATSDSGTVFRVELPGLR